MPFVTPKGNTTTAASNNAAGRTTFRPPWVKDDAPATTLKTANKTPWAKKTTTDTPATSTSSATASKENGEKPNATTSATAKKTTTTPPATKSTTDGSAKKTVASNNAANAVKKAPEPAKKVAEPVKKPIATVKKVPEPVKKPTATTAASKPTTAAATKTTAATAASKKKPPMPSSSEEEVEEEEETEEEETEEESEEEESEEEEESDDEDEEDDDDEDYTINLKQDPSKPIDLKLAAIALKPTPTKKQQPEEESELKRRFSLEKPKLRPVMVKRDKSIKKVEDNEDNELNEEESEEERERRLRFKLEKPKLRHVKREEKPLPSKSTDNILKIRPVLKKVSKVDEILKEPKEEPKPEFKTKTLRKAPSIKREASIKNVPAPPPLPSLVPKAPPPPPPPAGADKRNLTEAQKAALERLKTRPRRRPDWSEMMKEVESGRKLRHVVCNDRSQPIITCKSMTKVDNKFIYETEKGNSHNKLLKQIQGGVRLKPTQTNDRSKPILEGLRKFRRQMTIEEQLQKSQSKVNMLGDAPDGAVAAKGVGSGAAAGGVAKSSIISAISIEESSADELDDIDKLRDDLQSTKQMLALELRNREAQERENKKLLAKITTLEAELEREKSREKNLEYGSNVIVATMDPTPSTEQLYVNSLKKEAEDARKISKDLEKKYLTAGELLDQAKLEIDEQKRQIQMLERKLAQALQDNITTGTNHTQFNYCYSHDEASDWYDDDATILGAMHGQRHRHNKGGGSLDGSRRPSDAHTGRDSSPDFELELSESDPDEPEEKKQERREKRLVKEVKVLHSKLTKLKVKEEAAKKEKDALKQAMKKNHVILKEEQKKFKKLEKEVQKMAASMKLDDEDLDLDDDEADAQQTKAEDENAAEEEQESEEESSEESEESESEEEEEAEKSESEAEDAPNADKKANLEPRVKQHESRLSAMKKCNVLLQANVDNLQDEISQVRSKAANLQSELDSVLADLGF